MALDMSKYEEMMNCERKLPILFIINEKICNSEGWTGGTFRSAIADIMENLEFRGIKAEMALISFGSRVSLKSGFKPFCEYTESDWPETKAEGKSSFELGLALANDFIEDKDTTPDGNYDPVVIFISSENPVNGYSEALERFTADGRFEKLQRIGICDLSCDINFFRINHIGLNHKYNRINLLEEKIPCILKKFAQEKQALFIHDTWDDSWCTLRAWDAIKTKDEAPNHFCPVLDMIELRYTKDGERYTERLSGSNESGC